MIKKGIVISLLSAMLLLAIVSCTTRLGTFTVLSTKNIDWSRADEYTRNSGRIKGEDALHIILIIPTKFLITIQEAVDQALESVPGAVALTDVVVEYRKIPMFFYTQYAYIVEGNALIDSELAAGESSNDNLLVYYDKDGELIQQNLSDVEYQEFQQKMSL